ncbi:MAG TPA: cytochrome b/b6 domain-containing protein, partial [Thermomonas sp.]|nr:cytochrome b/b6 domain-containing protein [Thermomonas sp.]
MPLKNTIRWGAISQCLHWLTLVLLLLLAWIGLRMGALPNGPDKIATYALHKSIGLCVLAIVLLRIGWRLFAGSPTPLTDSPHWQHRIAQLTHIALYVLLLAMPL